MSIAQVLIRPQLLDRRSADDGAAALDLMTGLGSRLLADFLQGGPASQKITTAAQTTVTGFVSQFQPRLLTSRTKLLDWLKPYLSIIESITENLGDDQAENLLAVTTSLVTVTDKLLEDLHSTRIADRLNELADILENDLGISWDTFEQFFDSIFDNATNALSADFLQGSQSEEAVNNFLIGRQLLSLRRVAKEQADLLPLPQFNRRALIRDLQIQLTAGNWDETLDRIREKLATGPGQLQEMLPLLTSSMSPGVGSRAARSHAGPPSGQYSWYASWFRAEGASAHDRFDLSTEPFAEEMHFTDIFSLKFLENWALITAALEEAARALKYGFDLDNGNRLSPALNLGWQAGMGVMTLLSYLVEGEKWVDFYKVKGHTAFVKGVPEALSLVGSFEQFPGFWGWLWATWQHDRGNTNDGMTWPKIIREGLLSLFTLINSDNASNTKNHEKISGFTQLSRKGGAYIAALIMGRKDRYYSIFSSSFGLSVLVILGGGVITWAFDIIGWLIAGATARRLSERYWEFESDNFGGSLSEFFGGKNAYGSLFYSFIEFYTTWGSFWEGKTDQGKFGLIARSSSDGTFNHTETTFLGYPAKAESPYRLPFEKDQLVFCTEAHNGFSEHNFRKGKIYAVNFLLNEGEIVLAMRGGTVVDYRDDLSNGSDFGPNYVLIRHDELDARHDRGENGRVGYTYARYEHSSPFGVRQAFAAIGIPEKLIRGTHIQQGFPLLRIGKRPGFFNFDHLQVQVSTGATDGFLPSIPFVFKDIPGDGVPKKGKYYGSGNRSKIPLDASLFHPGEHTGWIIESGADYVKISASAADSDEAYKDAHLLIWYELPENETWYEYKKITAYKSGERKLTIEGGWSAGFPPPVSAQYRIGGRKFGHAGAFDKRFAYLANRNAGNLVIPFSDGRLPYLLVKTGYFHAPAVSGQITGGGVLNTNELHLDAQGDAAEHVYNFRHLIIRRNGAIIQYRTIRDYRIEAGVKKIFIDGLWDIALQTAGTPDSYEIGEKPYWQPNSAKKQAFHAPDVANGSFSADKFPDEAPPYRYYTFPQYSS